MILNSDWKVTEKSIGNSVCQSGDGLNKINKLRRDISLESRDIPLVSMNYIRHYLVCNIVGNVNVMDFIKRTLSYQIIKSKGSTLPIRNINFKPLNQQVSTLKSVSPNGRLVRVGNSIQKSGSFAVSLHQNFKPKFVRLI